MEVQNRIVEQTNIQLGRQLVQREFRTNSPGVIFEVEGMISQFWLHRVLPHELLNWPVELLKLKRVSVIPHRLDDWIKHKGHWPKELPQLFMPIANACWQRFSHLRNIQRWQVSWKLHHSGWVTDAGVSNCQSADHVLSSHNHGAIIRPLSSCVVDLTQDCVPRIPMYQALLATENNDTNELNNDIDWHWPMTLVDIHDWQWLTDWLTELRLKTGSWQHAYPGDGMTDRANQIWRHIVVLWIPLTLHGCWCALCTLTDWQWMAIDDTLTWVSAKSCHNLNRFNQNYGCMIECLTVTYNSVRSVCLTDWVNDCCHHRRTCNQKHRLMSKSNNWHSKLSNRM